MKKATYYLACVIMLSVFACSSKIESSGDNVITLLSDVTEIEVPASGGTYTINMSVHGSMPGWASVIPSTKWAHLYPFEGSIVKYDSYRKVTAQLTVDENIEDNERTQDICIYTLYDRTTITVRQAGLNRRGCVALETEKVEFQVDKYTYEPVGLSAYEDVEVVLPENTWIQTAELPEGIIPANTDLCFYVAPDGPASTDRTAEIIFRGKKTGKITILSVTQQAAPVVDGFPARWDYATSFAPNCGWTTSAFAPANYDNGKDAAVVTAVGVNNRRLKHVIASTYVASVAVTGMYTGDYLLFSVPVKSLPAGCAVDAALTIAGDNNDCPKYWIAEIYDGGEWCKPQDSDLKQVDGEDYSFYVKYFKAYQHCTFLQSFILKNAVTDGFVKVRYRVVGNKTGNDGTLAPDNNGTVYLSSRAFHFATLTAYPSIALKGKKKVAILGNSFTFYYSTHALLKELARSNGYQLDIRANTKGSQTLGNHLNLERSIGVASETGYDYVFLQEHSTYHSEYAQKPVESILNDTKELSARFRKGSPSAKIILEDTWAFPKSNWMSHGSSKAFSDLQLQGAKSIASQDPNCNAVSPIGVAFHTAYSEGLTDLYHTDGHHPNRNGSYLKACVNYLVIFGEPFGANTSDGGCEPAVAARLRDIAERTVLGHESEYYIER